MLFFGFIRLQSLQPVSYRADSICLGLEQLITIALFNYSALVHYNDKV